jgi:hypothetical protein
MNKNFTPKTQYKALKTNLINKNPIKVSLQNLNSRKQAIFAHCWQCCGGQSEPTDFDREVRREIRHCEITSCSLHRFRKYKQKKPVALAGGTGLDSSCEQISEVSHED